MSCAGAGATCEPFLAKPVLSLVLRNCLVPMRLCLRFGPAMRELCHRGIGIVSSGAGLVGAPNLLAYAFSKPLRHGHGRERLGPIAPRHVDVLALVLEQTDTPALRRLLESPDETPPIPGTATVDEGVADALAKLSDGPTWFVGEMRAIRNSSPAAFLDSGGGAEEPFPAVHGSRAGQGNPPKEAARG
jgi:uncharacterized protein